MTVICQFTVVQITLEDDEIGGRKLIVRKKRSRSVSPTLQRNEGKSQTHVEE